MTLVGIVKKYEPRRLLGLLLASLMISAPTWAQKKTTPPPRSESAPRQPSAPAPRPAYHPAANNNRGPASNVSRSGYSPGGRNGGVARPNSARPGTPGYAGKPGASKTPYRPHPQINSKVDARDPRRSPLDHRPAAASRQEWTNRRFGNRTASYDPHGRLRDVHAGNMDIHRGLHGSRRIISEHNGRTIVSNGFHRGYVQRAYWSHGGHEYIQRTYFHDGHRYAYAYSTYHWHGAPYYRYAPAYYYHPVFYAWAYNPWPAPVYYAWGWGPNPWYGYYGYYFAPAPYYPTASLWLTDFLLAANLQAAYESRQNADQQESADVPAAEPQAAQNDSVQLSPEVKQMIANEVQRQVASQQHAAAQGAAFNPAASSDDDPPPALDPNLTVFVVSSNLDVTRDDGQECELSSGDVITRIDSAPDTNNSLEVMVTATKKNDCEISSKLRVQVTDLQEMHNHFCEQIDAGLQTLAANQGKGGLPKAPDTGTTAGEVPSPAPDSDAESQIQGQEQQGNQAESGIEKTASSSSGPSGAN